MSEIEDITSFEALVSSGLQGKTIKWSRDSGTWRFGFSWRNNPSYGKRATWQVSCEMIGGHHSCAEISPEDFQNGLVVRAALPYEITGKRWSYPHDSA